MAFRAISRRHAAVPIAALLGGTTLLYPKRTLHAEVPPDAPELEIHKKPIYDSPPSPSSASTMSPPTQAPSFADSPSPTPTERLSVYVSHARMRTYHGSLWLEDHLNSLMTSALHLENNFTTTIASLAPPKESGEQLLPGLIYVLVSTMAGSIISRNRGILLRAMTPLAAGIAAGGYFIPVTTRNVGDLVWEGEKRVPGVAEGHMQMKGFLEEAWRQSVIHGKVAGDWADKTVGQGREIVEGWVRKGR